MRFLIPATHLTAFGKTALRLSCIALLLAGGTTAVPGQSAPDGSTPAQAINFSTRMRVQTGDNVGIGGFIISGTGPKHVLLRAIGPSLTQAGVPDALADPVLELRSSSASLRINDNWKDDAVQRALIEASGIPPTNDFESAIDATLDPGGYTAIVSGKNNTLGVALIEVYDLNQAAPAALANISTRTFVDTASNVLIAGVILGNNSGNDMIAVRGIGPSLAVTNALADPTLELRDSNGSRLIMNDDWQDDSAQAAELMAASLAPTNELESGFVTVLQPGSYTALLSGLNQATGVGLVEVYDLGTPPSAGAVDVTITRTQAGNSGAIEKQHVTFAPPTLSGTFIISVYHPATINRSDIGSRAALHGRTPPISFGADATTIAAAIKAVDGYYAYGQFGNLEFGPGGFSYFTGLGATNREPKVTLESVAGAGFEIQFGELVGDPAIYNTWVAGMPLITIEVQ
jgi:hypothetical protein